MDERDEGEFAVTIHTVEGFSLEEIPRTISRNGYDVILHKPYTVKQFCEEIFSIPNLWGEISIYDDINTVFNGEWANKLDYRDNKIRYGEFSKCQLESNILKSKAIVVEGNIACFYLYIDYKREIEIKENNDGQFYFLVVLDT